MASNIPSVRVKRTYDFKIEGFEPAQLEVEADVPTTALKYDVDRMFHDIARDEYMKLRQLRFSSDRGEANMLSEEKVDG